MRRVALVLPGLALLVLHQDLWLWDDPTLVLGFLPAGLAWHAGFSLACSVYFAAVARAVLGRPGEGPLDEPPGERPEDAA